MNSFELVPANRGNTDIAPRPSGSDSDGAPGSSGTASATISNEAMGDGDGDEAVPAAPVVQQTAWEYLKNYENLPEIIIAFLNLDEEVADKIHPKLLNSVKVRDLAFTIPDPANLKWFNTLRVAYQVRSLFVYVSGRELEDHEVTFLKKNAVCRGKIFAGVVVPVVSELPGGGDYAAPPGATPICSLPSCKFFPFLFLVCVDA